MSSARQLRVGETVRRALVEIFQRNDFGEDILSNNPLTISEARMSADLRYVKVWVLPLLTSSFASVNQARIGNKAQNKSTQKNSSENIIDADDIESVMPMDNARNSENQKIEHDDLHDDSKKEELLAALKRATPKIHSALRPKLRLRHIPRLLFIWDESFDHSDQISALLREAASRNEI